MNKQPILGIVATILVVGASLSIALFGEQKFINGIFSIMMLSMIPAQVVTALFWRANPSFAANATNPVKGIMLLGFCMFIGAFVFVSAFILYNGGDFSATPFVIMPLILSVPVTVLQIVIFNGWPFTKFIKSEFLQGIAILIATYVIVFIIDKTLFNFAFAEGAPFYKPELDPKGAFIAWFPLVAMVASVYSVLFMVMLDFWGLGQLFEKVPALAAQPVKGIVSSLVVGAFILIPWVIFVNNGMDIVVYMSKVAAPLIFGAFILLVMMRGATFISFPQPIRGIVLIVIAIILAALMHSLYAGLATNILQVKSGKPTYDLELWVASAMLSITFPLMVIFGDFLDFWPINRQK